MKNSLIDLSTSLAQRDLGQAYAITERFFRGLGFGIVNAAMIDPQDPGYSGMHSNMRPEWLRHYVAERYHECDVALDFLLKTSGAKFFCAKALLERKSVLAHGSMNEDTVIRMVNELESEGFRNSLIISRHSNVSSKIIGLNLATDLSDEEAGALVQEHHDEILLAAALSKNAILEDGPPGQFNPGWVPLGEPQPELSERETEVLKWLSRGFRNDRIAEKMGISPATVNFHIVSAKKRLGAKTREQAVAIAVMRGLTV